LTDRSVRHATFVLERTYDAPPGRVCAAWADPAVKARWLLGPEEWAGTAHELDFRVGGRERNSAGPRGGPVHSYVGTYYDIVPERRIVLAYEMRLDDTRISVSLATVELLAAGAGTRLISTSRARSSTGTTTRERASTAGANGWTRSARRYEEEHGEHTPAPARA
jgi:uncharacterized protein YndB with AHSA1/START domain